MGWGVVWYLNRTRAPHRRKTTMLIRLPWVLTFVESRNRFRRLSFSSSLRRRNDGLAERCIRFSGGGGGVRFRGKHRVITTISTAPICRRGHGIVYKRFTRPIAFSSESVKNDSVWIAGNAYYTSINARSPVYGLRKSNSDHRILPASVAYCYTISRVRTKNTIKRREEQRTVRTGKYVATAILSLFFFCWKILITKVVNQRCCCFFLSTPAVWGHVPKCLFSCKSIERIIYNLIDKNHKICTYGRVR